MMPVLKAIETRYKGYRFRSRLEARWAVFFDALGIEWEYEKEGYDLGEAGWYLPDFWLPQTNTWVEIKPDNERQTDPADEIGLRFREHIYYASSNMLPLNFGDHIVCNPSSYDDKEWLGDMGICSSAFFWFDCAPCPWSPTWLLPIIGAAINAHCGDRSKIHVVGSQIELTHPLFLGSVGMVCEFISIYSVEAYEEVQSLFDHIYPQPPKQPLCLWEKKLQALETETSYCYGVCGAPWDYRGRYYGKWNDNLPWTIPQLGAMRHNSQDRIRSAAIAAARSARFEHGEHG